jgi:nitric oxide reductase subunit B
MEHGTLWGHGAYLGHDYSAEYLHQEAETIRDLLAKKIYDTPFIELSSLDQGTILDAVSKMVKENR